MLKPAECAGCPLESIGEGFVPGFFPTGNIRIAIQGEAPGSNEIDEAKPFVGKAGGWLKKYVLGCAGIAEDEFAADNTLRCLPPVGKNGEAYPVGDIRVRAEKHCRCYDNWEALDSKIPLILAGNKAMNQWLGHEGISEWHGSVSIFNGRIVCPTFHPAAIMRQPNLLPIAVKEVSNALQAAKAPLEAMRRPLVHKV